MTDELIKKLLEAGVHFGHQTERWNPKMQKFIFGQRNGIYIIDLQKTAVHLNNARDFIRDAAGKGGRVLFVGTKKQAQMIIEEEAKAAEMFYVKNRWLGGLLTNFQTVRKSIDRLNAIEEMDKNGVMENLKKKEVSRLMKEKEKLLKDLGGIREMKKIPDVVFIVDPKKEEIAVHESNKLGIPIVAVVDTNCDPDVITYPIPGNDDALKSIRLIVSMIAESIKEGRKEYLNSETIKRQSLVKEAPQLAATDEAAKKDPEESVDKPSARRINKKQEVLSETKE